MRGLAGISCVGKYTELGPAFFMPHAPPLVQRTLSPHCQAPVVHDVVAGPGLTAFITRSPNELPEVHHMKLLQRWE